MVVGQKQSDPADVSQNQSHNTGNPHPQLRHAQAAKDQCQRKQKHPCSRKPNHTANAAEAEDLLRPAFDGGGFADRAGFRGIGMDHFRFGGDDEEGGVLV